MADERMEIVGYANRSSVAPGEAITFMVSSRAPRYDASLVRLRVGEERVPSSVDGTYSGCEQVLRAGSFGIVRSGIPLAHASGFAVVVCVLPTLLDGRRQTLVRAWRNGAGGYALELDRDGKAVLVLGNGSDVHAVTLREPPAARSWHLIGAGFDTTSGRAWIASLPAGRGAAAPARAEAEGVLPSPGDAPVLVAARLSDDGQTDVFNGKLEAPALFARTLSVRELDALATGSAPWELEPAPLAAWDFARDVAGTTMVDVAGDHDGELVNQPGRAVTGRRWTGRVLDFTVAPDEYAAAHFHEDDLEDAGWEPAFTLSVPDSLRSGFYAARLVSEHGADTVPFVVTPRRGHAAAAVLVLAPTLTYRAYANEHESWFDPVRGTPRPGFEARASREDRYGADHRLLSLYDRHSDGSGVCYVSLLRPQLTTRPGISMPVAGVPHGLGADLYLVDWLEQRGTAYDVVADEDLDDEGVDLLDAYSVVVTGTHPEYWTERMLTAVTTYVDHGGRLMYLGGNGFYWVTSLAPGRAHVLEVRRGSAGTGPFRGQPGEGYHSTTGEPGGLWRFRGRAPQALTGVGFAAMGHRGARPYERARAIPPHLTFIFEGVPAGAPIGESALGLGGAAAIEIDRLDHALGTPAEAILLASATGFPPDYVPAGEDVTTAGDADPQSLVRADMVYTENRAGGAVFAVGSIGWCFALSADGYGGSVARITGNVLDHFVRRKHAS
jgi:N,N-dimethylformamidase beta subunit-like protein